MHDLPQPRRDVPAKQRRHPASPPVRIGGQVRLPATVSAADWSRELGRWQNPRIRAILGCLRLIENVLESNFAVLHCSPTRLIEMLTTVHRVADIVRGDISLLLDGRSVIPELEGSRRAIRANLRHLESSLLRELDGYPTDLPEDRHPEVRKFLCVAVGQLHRFLQDSFGSLMAADPRAVHDADYYLSRHFPRDVEEAEWLYQSVLSFESALRAHDADRRVILTDALQHISYERRIPSGAEWIETGHYLDRLATDLASKLRDVTALRGIRLEELELLNQYATEIPTLCRIVSELHSASLEALDNLAQSLCPDDPGRAAGSPELRALQEALSDRILPRLRELDGCLRDLAIFVPLWRRGISQRRALLLRSPAEGDPSPAWAPADDRPDLPRRAP